MRKKETHYTCMQYTHQVELFGGFGTPVPADSAHYSGRVSLVKGSQGHLPKIRHNVDGFFFAYNDYAG